MICSNVMHIEFHVQKAGMSGKHHESEASQLRPRF